MVDYEIYCMEHTWARVHGPAYDSEVLKGVHWHKGTGWDSSLGHSPGHLVIEKFVINDFFLTS